MSKKNDLLFQKERILTTQRFFFFEIIHFLNAIWMHIALILKKYLFNLVK